MLSFSSANWRRITRAPGPRQLLRHCGRQLPQPRTHSRAGHGGASGRRRAGPAGPLNGRAFSAPTYTSLAAVPAAKNRGI